VSRLGQSAPQPANTVWSRLIGYVGYTETDLANVLSICKTIPSENSTRGCYGGALWNTTAARCGSVVREFSADKRLACARDWTPHQSRLLLLDTQWMLEAIFKDAPVLHNLPTVARIAEMHRRHTQMHALKDSGTLHLRAPTLIKLKHSLYVMPRRIFPNIKMTVGKSLHKLQQNKIQNKNGMSILFSFYIRDTGWETL